MFSLQRYAPSRISLLFLRSKKAGVLFFCTISAFFLISSLFFTTPASFAATAVGGYPGSDGVAQAWKIDGVDDTLFLCASPSLANPVGVTSAHNRGTLDYNAFVALNPINPGARFAATPEKSMAGASWIASLMQTGLHPSDQEIAAASMAMKWFYNEQVTDTEIRGFGWSGNNGLAGATDWVDGSLNASGRAVDIYNHALTVDAGVNVNIGTVTTNVNATRGSETVTLHISDPGGLIKLDLENATFVADAGQGLVAGQTHHEFIATNTTYTFKVQPVFLNGQPVKIKAGGTYEKQATGGFLPKLRVFKNSDSQQTIVASGGQATGSAQTTFTGEAEPFSLPMFAPMVETQVTSHLFEAGAKVKDVFTMSLRQGNTNGVEWRPQWGLREDRTYVPVVVKGDVYKHPINQPITRQTTIPTGATKVASLHATLGGGAVNPLDAPVTVTADTALPSATELASGRYTIVTYVRYADQSEETKKYLPPAADDFVSDYGITEESFLSPPKVSSKATTTSGLTMSIGGVDVPVAGLTMPLKDTILVEGDVITSDGYTLSNTHYTFPETVEGYGFDAKPIASNRIQPVCDANTLDVSLPAIPLNTAGNMVDAFTTNGNRVGVGVWVHTLLDAQGNVLHVSDCADKNQWTIVVPPKVESVSHVTTGETMHIDGKDIPATGLGLHIGDQVTITGVDVERAGYQLQNAHYTFEDTLDEYQNPIFPTPGQLVCDASTRDHVSQKYPVTTNGVMNENFRTPSTRNGVGVWQHTLFDREGKVLHVSDCADQDQWTIVKQVLIKTDVAEVTETYAVDTAKIWGTAPPGSTIVFELFCKTRNNGEYTLIASTPPAGLPSGLLNGYIVTSQPVALPDESDEQCSTLFFVETSRDLDENILSKGFPEDPRETVNRPRTPVLDPLGRIEVLKTVVGEATGLIPADTVFFIDFSYEKEGHVEPITGTLNIPLDGKASLEELPLNTVVTFTETRFPVIDGVLWGEAVFTPGDMVSVEEGTLQLVVENVALETPTPGFTLTKTSDPQSGTHVEPGDLITYTVTGVNTGNTVLDPVVITDDLGKVLTYASLVDTPKVSLSDGSASLEPVVFDGDVLTWEGVLLPGQSVSLIYTVKIHENLFDITQNEGVCVLNLVNGNATPPGGEEIVPPPSETEHCVPPTPPVPPVPPTEPVDPPIETPPPAKPVKPTPTPEVLANTGSNMPGNMVWGVIGLLISGVIIRLLRKQRMIRKHGVKSS